MEQDWSCNFLRVLDAASCHNGFGRRVTMRLSNGYERPFIFDFGTTLGCFALNESLRMFHIPETRNEYRVTKMTCERV